MLIVDYKLQLSPDPDPGKNFLSLYFHQWQFVIYL